jgi:hypothetical protein
MPKSVVDRVNFIDRDQPIQPVFLARAGNSIGDGDADYEEDPANPTANLPGEVIPKVAPDHVKITGVDAENAEPIEFQADLTSSVEIPGVNTAQQRIEINDLDLSLPQEPALIEPAKPDQPRRSGRERKATQSMPQACLARAIPTCNWDSCSCRIRRTSIQARLWKWS